MARRNNQRSAYWLHMLFGRRAWRYQTYLFKSNPPFKKNNTNESTRLAINTLELSKTILNIRSICVGSIGIGSLGITDIYNRNRRW